MKAMKLFLISLTAAISLMMLLVACSGDAPESTPTPLPEETPQPEMTVTAEEELEPEATSEIEAEESPTPLASGLTAVIVSGDTAGAGKPFTFDATQSEAGEADIVQYVWTMGDGATLFGLSVEHAYTTPGFYTVNLIITDEDGQTDTAAKVVEVLDLEATSTPPAEGESALIGTTWKLDNAIRGTTITLAFDEDNVSGSAGCNEYSARYTYTVVDVNITEISISSITTGNDSCTLEVMAQEQGYLESLASTKSATVDEAKLSLETGGGTLIFTEVAE